ncbi:MAG: group 1 glycosyl transferase, partial [Terracidiphilus sp.]
DIFVYRRLNAVFEALDRSAIAITPHCLTPNEGDAGSETILLKGGVFNLGFVAVSKCEEAERFLNWWEQRCLDFGFNEPGKGTAFDQKWINLVPCFFERVAILKHPGCNVAWWNLYERELSLAGGELVVNGSVPLEFFHFSGISVDSGDKLSRRNSPFTLSNRPDIGPLYQQYRAGLEDAGVREFKTRPYAFGSFENGQYINRLTRSLYAANLQVFQGENPFSPSSRFYHWARSIGIFGTHDSANAFNSETYAKTDLRLRILRKLFRLALRVLGADRYTLLLKYLAWVSIPLNQHEIFPA